MRVVVTLIGGLAKPSKALGLVLRNPPAMVVMRAEVLLGDRIACFRQRSEQPERRRIVAARLRRNGIVEGSLRAIAASPSKNTSAAARAALCLMHLPGVVASPAIELLHRLVHEAVEFGGVLAGDLVHDIGGQARKLLLDIL